MKKLLKTNYDRSTEYYKIQHSIVRIDQATVSNVRPKKTTSFEQRKTNVEQMNLEEKQVNI